MQDPDTVSQGLKVIALRVRGVKSELEDMGEETEGILNTSKLQGKIKALTGVDLLDETNGFRNIYDILMEIADVWDDLDSMSQASVIELMAGKNRANVFTSIMKQADTIKSAYNIALGSEGSAMAENEKHLNSIQGRMELFTNALQTMWVNALDSDTIKFFVDAGTAIVKFVDAVGLLPTLTGAFVFIKELKNGFGEAKISTQDFRKEILELSKARQNNGVTDSVADSIAEEAMAEQEKAKAKMESSAASVAEATTSKIDAEANLAQAEASQMVQIEKAKEVKALTAAENADVNEAATSKMNAAENTKQAGASSLFNLAPGLSKAAKGAKMFMGAFAKASVTMVAVSLLTKGIGFLTDKFKENHKSAEELAQEVSQLKNSYNQVSSEIKNNISTISGLEEEFNRLSKGVNELGQNVSLSVDDYARYQEIVQQLVGISPSLISGYDKEGNAIANKNGLIERSIELMEKEQQLEARKLTSGDNGKKIIKDIDNRYNKKKEEFEDKTNNYRFWFEDDFDRYMSAYEADDPYNFAGDIYKQFAEAWGSKGNLTPGDIPTNRDFANWYYDEIVSDLRSGNSILAKYLNKEQVESLKESVVEYEKNLKDFESELELISSEYNEALQQELMGMDEYYTLDKDMRGYAQNYVLNLDINADNFDEKKKELESFIDYLNSDSVSVRNLIDEGEKIISKKDKNGNSLSFEQYTKQIREFKAKVQSGNEQDKWIVDMLGLNDYGEIEKSLKNQTDHIKGLLKPTEKDIGGFINSLDMTDLELALKITATDGSNTMTIDEVKNQIANLKNELGIDVAPIATYSTVSESVEKYNAAIEQTSEIISNNTEVTEEYKKSLIELGISEEELNEHFYESNKLMVKDEKGLKKLITATKNNISSNLKLSKTQAALKYYDLVKEMGKAVSGKKQLDAATMQNINSMMQEADSVRQSIIQYKRLEYELNGVSNAFTKFNEAKEIDALNTKPDTFLEAVNLMEQTITQTGEFGTESFWAAVDMTIPPEVYQGLESDVQRIEAIISYFNSDVKKLLTIGEDDIQIDFDSMERFFNEMNNKGLLEEGSTLGDWTFAETQNLESLSETMGLTTDQLKAMFDAMDKFNINREALPLSLQLDDSIEGQILKVTNDIDELQRKKIELLSEGNGGYDTNKEKIDEINQKIHETNTSMSNLVDKNLEHIHSYVQLDTVISKLEEFKNLNQELTQTDYDGLGLSNLNISFDEASAMSAQELIDTLLAKKLQLGEPTKLQAQFAMDEIDKQIALIELKIQSAKDAKINSGIAADTTELDAQLAALREEKVNIATQFDIELPEDEKNKLITEMGEVEEFKINNKTFFVRANINSAWLALRSINSYQFTPKVVPVTTSYQGPYRMNDPGRPRVNGTAHADGTAYAGGNWGAPKTETALTGELGPEMRVRGNKWELLGENGAEFNEVKKGDIIFNHKQTKSLLENGYVNSRGKAYASGTALANGLYRPTGGGSGSGSGSGSNGNGSNNSNSSSASEAANDFKEVFDWFEVKLEEINELLDLWGAQLENIVDLAGKGAKIDNIIDKNKYKLDILAQGLKLYEGYTNQLLSEIPAQYREAAKNGQIAIETFAGDAGEKTLEAINNYREWAKKVADVQQQMEELTQTIADLAKQKFDIIDEGYDNKISLMELQIDRLKDSISLTEDRGNIASSQYYDAMTNITNDRINKLQEEHKLLQKSLDESVEAGDIAKYSDRWYEMVEAIYNVDKELMECTSSLEGFQNSINELNWDNFDELINRLEYLSSETDSLIDLMEQTGEIVNYPKDNEYWGSKDVAWSKEGITSLGLYAQKMEIAEYMSDQYAKAIDNLNKDYNAGKYSMSEYQEKLDELKQTQYDSIKNYYDAQDAIVDLNKTRVDAIKDGINKEIEAYEKLINKKKEELNVEKDMYDFQQGIAEKQKDISAIERKISALSMDNSASAVAQKKKLEAELADARSALDEAYYDRSITDQQNALDNELDNFKEQKDAEIEKWEKYLEDVQKVVVDSLNTVQINAIDVYDTLSAKASEYNLTLSDAIMTPWKDGESAVSSYQNVFNTASSSTYEQLGVIKQQWQDIIDLMTKAANVDISNLNADNQSHVAAEKKQPPKQTTPTPNTTPKPNKPSTSVGSTVTVKSTATHFSTGQRMANFVPGGSYTVYQDNGDRVLIGKNGVYTGWIYKKDIQGYASGSLGLKKSGLINVDELGEELILGAHNGRLTYVEKGTGIIPADITSNLMSWGELNPQEMLNRSRASVGVNPAISSNNVNIDINYGDILHIDNFDGNNPEDVAKLVEVQFNKHTKKLNEALKKYSR